MAESAAAPISLPSTTQLPVVGKSQTKPTWCPGCGDFGVVASIEMALKRLKIPSKDVVIVSGIGCSSNLPHFLSSYGFHGIHGRAIPLAEGIRWGNHGLTVVATGGDGDGFGIGVGHLVHAMRRNVKLTYVTMDNQIYGLTTGQASPTTTLGHKTKSTPTGVIENPLDPVALALASGATYVARGFSGDVKHLTDLVAGGLQHKGFAFVDVFSPCVTYNKINTFDFFRQRVYKLESSGHDPSDKVAAWQRALEWGDKIPIGLLYRAEHPTYEDLEEVLHEGPLVHQRAGIADLSKVLDEFV
ncbi:MAG TPA: thiamine pyrophosphate-dependent enzyme [Thermoplasmata archaeon]|nr:thiamine pyrophosphate-dependent enzyme [Thermoplasmata archaeon]